MQKKTIVASLFVVGAAALPIFAHAALPAEATAAFTTISGNITDVLGAMWPLVAASVGGFTLIRLFKKGASRAV